MVCQLAYAQVGQQIEVELVEIISKIDTPNMASLSSKQLLQTNDLRQLTLKCEKDVKH
jgi:TusA-related sulfurtransferase